MSSFDHRHLMIEDPEGIENQAEGLPLGLESDLEPSDLELSNLELPELEPSASRAETSGGILYLVGTPIGNLGDITLRALETLKSVDLIAAEDTRHSGQLLKHFQITPRQLSYHSHNRRHRIPQIVERLLAGSQIALITDAGMPGISDPGQELVRACVKAGIPVVPIPGATAFVAGLVASGLTTERFIFEGFLPTQQQARHRRLVELQAETRTLIFYEAPHRLEKTLRDLAEVWGGSRQIVVARELTKRYEEFWRGSLESTLAYVVGHGVKGELTLIIEGADPVSPSSEDMDWISAVDGLMATGLSRSQAARQLAQHYGLERQQIYRASMGSPESPPGTD
ncbi:MAG: 16S rRNA (cytidine(1402)-2'-O)-methyltransferase [Cyanophyceae cyanobacterium]